MAGRAWKSVSATTIKNCWNHTKIQWPRLPIIKLRPPCPPIPVNLAAGWDLVVEFAMNSWSIPEAHSALQEHLGDQYNASDWNEPLDSALGAEGDVSAALAAVNAWHNKWVPDSPSDAPDSPSEAPDSPMATILDEHDNVEEELMELVAQLKAQRCIIGEPLTLDEMLDPIEEREIRECLGSFEGWDLDLEIIGMVQAKARGDVIEDISSDSDEDTPEVIPPLKEMGEACRKLEEGCLLVGTEDALDFIEAAHQLQGHLQKLSQDSAKQTTIDMYFNYK